MGSAEKVSKDASRKRKAHNKSRRGCGNCKLRRVKCDEGKPQCQKCVTFGVRCEYGAKAGELNAAPFMAGVFQVEIPKRQGPSLGQFFDDIATAVTSGGQQLPSPPASDGEPDPGPSFLDAYDEAVFDRFGSRTIWTLGSAISVATYAKVTPELALTHSFLMHMVLALTIRHDQYLSSEKDEPFDPRLSEREAYHWYEATAQFSHALSQTIKEADKDALWATAAMLGAMSLSDISATRPEEAWPLCPDAPNDLDWMRMGVGKTAVWEMVDPLRPTSQFSEILSKECSTGFNLKLPLPQFPLPKGNYVDEVLELCGIDPQNGECAPTNPYAKIAKDVAVLLTIECNSETILKFLVPLSHPPETFQALLLKKDPKALVLLAFWYAKIMDCGRWWIAKRSRLECRAIVMYLDKWYWQDVSIQKLLVFARDTCGLRQAGVTIFHKSNAQPPWMSGNDW